MGPILASKTYVDGGTTYKMQMLGGLCKLKGNALPYFSLTHDTRRKCKNGRWVEDSCGAGHETILKYFPRFADLAALHLSDVNGVPMHADANGWYFMAGSFPDAFGRTDRGVPQFRQRPGGPARYVGDRSVRMAALCSQTHERRIGDT